jgi:hypothetical protein
VNALAAYIDTFLGYGRLSAPLWFMGMEEGGGRDVAELSRRVCAWDARGGHSCEDLSGYHRAIGITEFFDEGRPRLQPTWCALMKALQAWRGRPIDTRTLHSLQTTEWGAIDGPVALLELLPLPAPTTDDWPYPELAAQMPALRDRTSYLAHVLPARTQRYEELVQQYQPAAVVCYGIGYLRHWESVFGVPLEPIRIDGRRCFGGRSGCTRVLVVPHPARANANTLWRAIGLHLRGTNGC